MGYGYGIWLIYNKNIFKEKIAHIGHITISCFMQKDEAKTLYDDITKNINTKFKLNTEGIPELFPINFYENDKNDLCSWGFNFKSNDWSKLETICKKYKCDFSHQPHTSIEYSKNPLEFKPYYIGESTFSCKVHLVDIRSDFPNDWKIIE